MYGVQVYVDGEGHAEDGRGEHVPKVAGPLRDPAPGVDALDGGRSRQGAVAAMLDHLEFERRNVVRGHAGRAGDDLAFHGAAVGVLPIRASVMPSDRLSVEDQRGNRLAKLPGQCANFRLGFSGVRACTRRPARPRH